MINLPRCPIEHLSGICPHSKCPIYAGHPTHDFSEAN